MSTSLARGWETVIGLETHAQLSTRSKIFSGASTAFGAPPNTQASVIDLALPGVLPVLNRGAVERAIRFGLAIGAKINPRSIFARKNYFYPDLPKNYQISQYEIPVVQGGTVHIRVGDAEKVVTLTRAHLEEDAGKSLHEDFHGMSGIDLNRAGTPLLEIVSEPELRSSAEAVAYAKTLHALVRWIGICDGNMQEGSFRCDANVSVRRIGDPKLGTRCEIKNLNSFRFLERAIEYEITRQIDLLEDGGRVVQETRLYDPDRDETRPMRSKEDAQDYRYFPDPDLLPLEIQPAWIEEVKATMPELPEARKRRYETELLFFPEDAEALTSSIEMSEYFEDVLKELKKRTDIKYGVQSPDQANAKSAANLIINDLVQLMNRTETPFAESRVSPVQMAGLLARSFDGTLSSKLTREVLARMWAVAEQPASRSDPNLADLLIEEGGLKQISDAGAIEKIIDEVLAANAKSVEEFRAGKDKAFNALVGQAMKATKGKANPAQVNEILKKKLASG